MGFSAGHLGFLIGRLLRSLAFVFACTDSAMCYLLYFVGLSDPLRYERNGQREFQEIPSALSLPSDGDMVRNKLPVIKFQSFADSCSEIDEEVMCAVCLSSLERADEIRELCNCSHIFHRNCLDKWIDHLQLTCPLRRCPLIVQTEILHQSQDRSDKDWISFLFESGDLVNSY
ncbi:hypothetical protein SUGI_1190870 [Cryptomeria japonica]|uniref:brassinosteroid-responsive RING protein 1-like n=1 Tax=Cryptomeria japonica TaxID=3369 RepID=UPI002414716F|nr:brassinosteroid-responsive RING protein 1-like [Cryptomeria japonica]GLJ55462.1 hypothetical protein SUGI_1190870 [Cryptomeria japonica]